MSQHKWMTLRIHHLMLDHKHHLCCSYEEITDLPSVFKYTQCPVYGMSTTSSTTVQVESHHEYEDVKLNNSDEQIQMTECPAYS